MDGEQRTLQLGERPEGGQQAGEFSARLVTLCGYHASLLRPSSAPLLLPTEKPQGRS